MSKNQTSNKSPVPIKFSDDDVFIMCDSLENTRAVVAFLGAASSCLSSNEEPLSSEAIFGIYLTHQWVGNQILSVENTLREARS